MDILPYVNPVAMLIMLGAGFVAMSRYGFSQALVMPMLASAFLVMRGSGAGGILEPSFAEFSHVAIVFTAIAIPAHQLQRSNAFRLAGIHLGIAVGKLCVNFPKARVPVLVSLLLVMTWVAAALFHNITSILVMVPIIVAICESYVLPSRWILCGALVASNLGGFSTSWGDTPNIIESAVWNLSQPAFLAEILPLNFVVLIVMAGAVAVMTGREMKNAGVATSMVDLAYAHATFTVERHEYRLDLRLFFVGLATLAGFIGVQFINRSLELPAGAAAMVFAVACDRKADRLHSLQSLHLDVYMTLVSAFIMARCISTSLIGDYLHRLIAATGARPWSIALASYFGTGLTEAASWASAIAPMTHAANATHAAAWALGAGICAGSSSILTAASAGIILWTETKRFAKHAIDFRTYLAFGLVCSLSMLAFYILVLTIFVNFGYMS